MVQRTKPGSGLLSVHILRRSENFINRINTILEVVCDMEL